MVRPPVCCARSEGIADSEPQKGMNGDFSMNLPSTLVRVRVRVRVRVS